MMEKSGNRQQNAREAINTSLEMLPKADPALQNQIQKGKPRPSSAVLSETEGHGGPLFRNWSPLAGLSRTWSRRFADEVVIDVDGI